MLAGKQDIHGYTSLKGFVPVSILCIQQSPEALWSTDCAYIGRLQDVTTCNIRICKYVQCSAVEEVGYTVLYYD